jgi:hypothetical protein
MTMISLLYSGNERKLSGYVDWKGLVPAIDSFRKAPPVTNSFELRGCERSCHRHEPFAWGFD